jgi:protein phosphatase
LQGQTPAIVVSWTPIPLCANTLANSCAGNDQRLGRNVIGGFITIIERWRPLYRTISKTWTLSRSCISLGPRDLAAAKLTVVDPTNVQEEARKPLVALAREYHCLPVAIVFDLPEKFCQERNRYRSDRTFGPHVIRQQSQQLRRSLRKLERDGFRQVFVLRSPEEVDAVTIERQPLWNNRCGEHGPFDVIGDIHGCYDELALLLTNLGYSKQPGGAWAHAENRKLIFVGDLVDRGPKIPEVVRLVLESVKASAAFCVPGNHDVKFMRTVRLRGQTQVS